MYKTINEDAVDILINERDPDKIVDICVAISDTFGGINLEDISAPRCFEIERKLQERNVLGFPFIFRGALDVRASKITENMKMAAAVAEAAIKDGVANVDNFDLEAYKKHMRSQMYLNHEYDEH